MALRPSRAEIETRTSCGTKGGNNMTAEDLKRRLRNSFESSLLQRIATAR